MSYPIESVQDFFGVGMKRKVPGFYTDYPRGLAELNLGAGDHFIVGAMSLDLPEWNADRDGLRAFEDGSVGLIHAYHFLEHLEDPLAFLFEVQRVLAPGGLINIVVPYYTSQMFAHDLTHRRAFCEETWRNTFKNEFYDMAGKRGEWRFRIGFNMICGIVERNLALLTQLIREDD